MTNLQQGGGYIYQWQVAALLALKYLTGELISSQFSLDSLITDYLGWVDKIHLEGELRKKHSQPSIKNENVDLEDINLFSHDKAILIQVKAKEKNQPWGRGDKQLKKALYKMYCNPCFDEDDPQVKCVFLSNRNINGQLEVLQTAIDKQTVKDCPQFKKLYQSLETYLNTTYTKNNKDIPCALDRNRLLKFISQLHFVHYYDFDMVKDKIKNRLKDLNKTETQADTIIQRFAEWSVEKRDKIKGKTVTRQMLLEFTFNGYLLDYIIEESYHALALNLINKVNNPHPSYPIHNPKNILKRLQQIIGDDKQDKLNSLEAFILVAVACLPHYLGAVDLDSQDIINFAKKMFNGTYLSSLDTEILTVLESNLSNLSDYNADKLNIEGEQVRISLLQGLFRLAKEFDFDEVNTCPPMALSDDQRITWWRKHGYVRSVNINLPRIGITMRLPTDKLEEYKPILVDSLDKKLETLIKKYDTELENADIMLKYRLIKFSGDNVLPIPDDEWEILEKEVRFENLEERNITKVQSDFNQAKLDQESKIKDDIDEAETLVKNGQYLEAANLYHQVACDLANIQDLVNIPNIEQAKSYTLEAIKYYIEANKQKLAVKQYIWVTNIALKHGYTITDLQLYKAIKLAKDIGNFSLEADIRLLEAWSNYFVQGIYTQAECYWEEVEKLLPQILDGQERIRLLGELTRQKTCYARIIKEDFEQAEALLQDAITQLKQAPQAMDVRLELLWLLMMLKTERGDWEKVDEIYNQAQTILSQGYDTSKKSLWIMHYANAQAYRGEIELAIEAYSKAIDLMTDSSDWQALNRIHTNLMHMIINNSNSGQSNIVLDHQTKRVDLIRQTQEKQQSYRYHKSAISNIAHEKYEHAYWNIQASLAYAWRKGDWWELGKAYNTLAIARNKLGHFTDALFNKIRTNDYKNVESFAQDVLNNVDENKINDIIKQLITPYRPIREKFATLKILKVLVDIIPSQLQPTVFKYLADFITLPSSSNFDMACQFATEAFVQYMPQLTNTQIIELIKLCLEQLKQKRSWFTHQKLIELLNQCFVKCSACDPNLYQEALIVIHTPDFSDGGNLTSVVKMTTANIAKKVPQDVNDIRKTALDYLKKHSEHFEYISNLAFLDEEIALDDLTEAIKELTYRMIPERSKFTFQDLIVNIRYFKDNIPQDLRNLVINRLLSVAQHRYGSLNQKRRAIEILYELPQEVWEHKLNEIVEVTLKGATLDMPPVLNPFVRIGSSSQRTIEEHEEKEAWYLRQIYLYALGRYYIFIDDDKKDEFISIFINCSQHQSPIIRVGVAVALCCIADKISVLPLKLQVTLIILLHDSAANVRSEAIWAAGEFIKQGAIDTLRDDIVGRLLYLVKTETETKNLVNLVHTLKAMKDSGTMTNGELEQIEEGLAMFSENISFQVRDAVSPKQLL